VSEPVQLAPEPSRFGRRSLGRVALDFPVRLQVRGLPARLSARTRDLGLGGVCIATASRFDFRSVGSIELMHPTVRLQLPAEGRWQMEACGEDSFLTGIAFESLDSTALDKVWDLTHVQTKYLTRWLGQMSDFHDLGLASLQELAQLTRLRDAGTGTVLQRQDARIAGDDSILLLMQGQVSLERRGSLGRRLAAADVEPGHSFGGLPLLTGVAPGETAIVGATARLLEISRGAFDVLRRSSPTLALEVASIVTRRHLERAVGASDRAVETA